MSPIRKRHLLPAGLLSLVLAGCSSDATLPDPQGRADNTTTEFRLAVSKTGTGEWTKKGGYDWSVTKTVSPASLTLAQGASGGFTFTINAVRTATGVEERYAVTGQVCVNNTGGHATSGLSIKDIFYEDNYIVLSEMQVDVSAKPVLNPGESHCYPYRIDLPAGFTPKANTPYKNLAFVYSTRPGGSVGDWPASTYVQWPTAPTTTSADSIANLVDSLTCPQGFTCTPTGATWTMNASGTQTLPVTITNVGATCGTTVQVPNTVVLTEVGSGTQHSANATGTVNTPACTPPPPPPPPSIEACTPGFWQGGFGSKLWNLAQDPNWKGRFAQPYTHSTPFNSFFASHPALAGQTMIDIISNGGGSVAANKAARSLVAAYLNVSYKAGYHGGITQQQLKDRWAAAVAGGDAALMSLHTELDEQNNRFDCRP